MNDEQYKRYRKMLADRIECPYQIKDKKNTLYFLIVGNTGVKYKISIYQNGQLKCSCPDFSNHCKSNNCICKHCLYLIFDKLKIIKTLEHKFFDRLYFTPDEMQKIYNIYK
jgi:hypothetical protein